MFGYQTLTSGVILLINEHSYNQLSHSSIKYIYCYHQWDRKLLAHIPWAGFRRCWYMAVQSNVNFLSYRAQWSATSRLCSDTTPECSSRLVECFAARKNRHQSWGFRRILCIFGKLFGSTTRIDQARAELRNIRQGQPEGVSAYSTRFEALLGKLSGYDENWAKMQLNGVCTHAWPN